MSPNRNFIINSQNYNPEATPGRLSTGAPIGVLIKPKRAGSKKEKRRLSWFSWHGSAWPDNFLAWLPLLIALALEAADL
jgi:hypothetical protein